MSELYSLHQCSLQAPEQPLHAVLADAITGLSRQKARQAIVAGLVSVDGSLQTSPTWKLGDEAVDVVLDLRHGLKNRQQQAPHEKPFSILFEDTDVCVIDKAAGILSAPSNSDDHGHIPELLRRYWRSQQQNPGYIGVVHRIDQATSGCLVLAKNKQAQQILSQQFHSHAAERQYYCLSLGQPRQDSDTLDAPIGRGHDGRRAAVDEGDSGKSAITHFTIRQRIGNIASELDVRLETGRTHQIRVHLAGIGCPVFGDEVYAKAARERGRLKGMPRAPRLMLHAGQIAFDHPRTGERISVTAPEPSLYTAFRKQLLRLGAQSA